MATAIAATAIPASDSALPSGQAAIECAGLSRRFGGLLALSEVGFRIAPGEIVGILGPNGAGKTTFISVLSGQIRATAGTVKVYGEDVSELSMAQRARRGLFRTFQNTRPSEELTGREMLRLAALTPNRTRAARPYHADELLETFGLTAYAGMIHADLPYGVQKMINLAAVALCGPRVLLLDEPFQGVADAEISRLADVIRHLASSGIAVGLVEHNVRSVMALCERVLVLDSGVLIFEGSGAQAVRDEKVQEAYLGQRFARELNG